jgi:type II secretory pathway pseudopilin PulG
VIRASRLVGPISRLHTEDRGASLVELLVATIIGAMVMSVIATTIFTTNDLRKRADDRSQFAGDVSIASLSFDRDGAMATKGASARTQTTSTSCATPIDLGFNEAGGNVRYRTVAGSPSGPSWLERVNGAGSRPLVKNVTACTWQTVRIGSGRYTIIVTMTLLGASGETMSQVLRAAPRLWP